MIYDSLQCRTLTHTHTRTTVCIISQGFLEYWNATSYESPAAPTVAFTMKLDTNLFDLAKAKTVANCIEVCTIKTAALNPAQRLFDSLICIVVMRA